MVNKGYPPRPKPKDTVYLYHGERLQHHHVHHWEGNLCVMYDGFTFKWHKTLGFLL